MAHKSPYYDRIKSMVDPKYDPRHVEAYMRAGHSTLDGLSAEEFAFEVKMCCYCVDEQGKRNAERVAKGFGL
jgi:hypothetical protein